jgi:predicted double-glycine peptidase
MRRRVNGLSLARQALAASMCAALSLMPDIHGCLARTLDQDAPRGEAVACGPNALLMFLTLCDVTVDDKVIEGIDCRPDGASLLELRAVCTSVGLPSEIRKYGAAEYASIPLPAILQARAAKSRHHFYVIYEVGMETLNVLDGTTGHRLQIPRERFESVLTGYALIPSHYSLRAILSNEHAIERWNGVFLIGNIALALYMCHPYYSALPRRAAACLRQCRSKS